MHTDKFYRKRDSCEKRVKRKNETKKRGETREWRRTQLDALLSTTFFCFTFLSRS